MANGMGARGGTATTFTLTSTSTLTFVLVLVLVLVPERARANGRMPGANEVLFDARDEGHLVARASFGIVQTHDAGEHWSWICEQVIDVSGVIADPPLALLDDGTLLLLPPTGSALISRDHGCSWTRVAEPLANKRGVDLTLDPSDAGHLLILTSTLGAIDAKGFGSYENQLYETRDGGRTFRLVASLPSDFEAETVEVARSDAQRLYVSGTASDNPRLGRLFRSENGGESFDKSELELPAGSGSLLISAIHPVDPDRLWLRVPARGDTIGILPARLYWSQDKGRSFQMLAATQRAMFGFALSPDGSRLAYGGPTDGLYVGAADGSGGFQKQNKLGLRCLRWNEGGLFACGTEPSDPFSLGVSHDEGASFRPLYRMVDTCPAACDESSSFAASCPAAWTPIQPFIRASGAMCGGETDAGVDVPDDAGVESEPVEGGTEEEDASEQGEESMPPEGRAGAGEGCGCRLGAPPRGQRGSSALAAIASIVGWVIARGRSRARRNGS